ncbi:hypothetical protein DP49_5697 [Burkholderia pseudomallei]|nr:hypothetical protein DP49_5697 [Burkholderia pseudomallei]
MLFPVRLTCPPSTPNAPAPETIPFRVRILPTFVVPT